jgi:hypothetical protein
MTTCGSQIAKRAKHASLGGQTATPTRKVSASGPRRPYAERPREAAVNHTSPLLKPMPNLRQGHQPRLTAKSLERKAKNKSLKKTRPLWEDHCPKAVAAPHPAVKIRAGQTNTNGSEKHGKTRGTTPNAHTIGVTLISGVWSVSSAQTESHRYGSPCGNSTFVGGTRKPTR